MTEDAAAARAAFIAFVESLDRARRVIVLHDFDADGVTAGVVLQRALERAGFGDVTRVIPTRERDAWAEVNRALLPSQSEDVAWLRAARAEVQREMAEAKKAAPKFANNVALVRIRSRCQVHPVIAQIWRTRLPKYIVIVANDGYLPGRVNFSMRTSSQVNLLDFLRAIDLGEGEGSYAHGHDQATGGSLPVERWEQLLAKLSF